MFSYKEFFTEIFITNMFPIFNFLMGERNIDFTSMLCKVWIELIMYRDLDSRTKFYKVLKTENIFDRDEPLLSYRLASTGLKENILPCNLFKMLTSIILLCR